MRHIKALAAYLFPKALWDKRWMIWLCVGILTYALFDLLWCEQTTYYPFHFKATYLNILFFALLSSFPAVFFKSDLWQTLLLLVIDLIMIANLIFCHFYDMHIPIQFYTPDIPVLALKESIIASFKPSYLLFPLLTLAGLVLSRKAGRRHDRSPLSGARIRGYVFLTILFAVFYLRPFTVKGGLREYFDERYLTVGDENASALIPTYGLVALAAYDLTSSDELSETDKTAINQWLDEHARRQQQHVPVSSNVPRNLIMIICESLESWPIGRHINDFEITPNLNGLVTDSSTYFARKIVPQTYRGQSADGQLLMLAGLLPTRHAIPYCHRYCNGNTYVTLADAIREQGGQSLLVSMDNPRIWHQGAIARSFGFDRYVTSEEYVTDETDYPSGSVLADSSFLAQTIEKIRHGELLSPDRPTLLTLVTHSGHYPFRPEAQQPIPQLPHDMPTELKDYIATAHYVDKALGRFIHQLKRLPDWNKTMVVIAGDHGVPPHIRQEMTAGYDDVTGKDDFIPLIILNSPVNATEERLIGQVDVYTTILDAAGMYNFKWKGMGFSAFDDRRPSFVISPRMKTYADTAAPTHKEIQSACDALEYSDLIIRGNLLRELYPATGDK